MKAVQGRLVGSRLADGAFTGARFAAAQRVLAFGNELQRMKLAATLTWQLRIEAPVNACQGRVPVQTGLL